MPKVYAEFDIACPVEQVYSYLLNRYQSKVFRSVSMMTKGYTPEIKCRDAQKNRHLTFWVSGRDGLTNLKVSSWTWSYDLTSSESGITRVSITYEWSILMSLLSLFTIRHQAANELAETALALEALAC